MAKQGQQVLLSPHRKADILALAIVRQESQAEVVRTGVEIFVPQLQHSHASALSELYGALDRMKVDREAALEDMAEVKLRADGTRRRLTLSDLKTADGQWRARYVFGTEPTQQRRGTRTA